MSEDAIGISCIIMLCAWLAVRAINAAIREQGARTAMIINDILLEIQQESVGQTVFSIQRMLETVEDRLGDIARSVEKDSVDDLPPY